MPPRAHNILSPSAAHRWFECPASALLEDGYPDSTSYDSALGTAVHDMCERSLTIFKETGDRDLADPAHQLGREIVVAGWDESFFADEKMVDGARAYVATVFGELARLDLGPDALQVEQRVTLPQIRRGMGGTADAVIRQPWGELVVIDYKNGRGYVDVRMNPQLMQYGLGAAYDPKAKEYDDYETVKLIVVQPNCDAEQLVRSWELPLEELTTWGEDVLKVKAKAAASKKAKPRAGEWCHWCKHQGQCGAVTDLAAQTAMTVFDPVVATPETLPTPPAVETLPPEKMGTVLAFAEMVSAWVKAVQHRVHALLESGEVTPEQVGWKRVYGRANNNWADNTQEMVVEKAKAHNVTPFEEPSLKSFAQLRDAIAAKLHEDGKYKTKKAAKERAAKILGDYITTHRGISLVPINDKREAIQPATSAFTPVAGEE